MTKEEWLERARLFLMRRRTAYLNTFKGPVARMVLKDLARFCSAADSTIDENPRVQEARDARREVWLRIQEHLHMGDEELWKLYHEKDE